MSLTSPPSAPAETLPLPSSTSQSTTRNNPISLRLWKITSRTTLDQPTQEALKIVSDRYCQVPTITHDGAAEAGPSRSKDYWLSSSSNWEDDSDSSFSDDEEEYSKTNGTEEKHRKKAYRTLLANADPDAAARARKSFKKDVEGELAKGSMNFLKAFGRVDDKLQILRSYLEEMQARCSSIQAELDSANNGTQSLLERAKGLQEQQASTRLRSELSSRFLEHFTLSVQETDALNAKDVNITEQLFAAMDRVKKIREDCAELFTVAGVGPIDKVGTEGKNAAGDQNQEGDGVEGRDPALAAKEIMSLASSQQDLAYDRIHRFCCFEFRKFTKDTQLEVSEILREAVRRLQSRESLLEDAVQILTNTRQASMLQSFLDALTRGGPDGFPRPIELHAHDPTRYIGDMLAWVHQATAGENEFLDNLFDVEKGRGRMVGQTRKFSTSSSNIGEEVDPAKALQAVREEISRACLDKNLEGLSRPLRVRIQDTVKSQEGVIMAYKIANLVQFYLVTMQRTIGSEAVLTHALSEIYTIAQQAFLATLEAQGRSLLRFLHAPENNLAPPVALREASHILHEIMSVYETSLVDDLDREADFAKILKAAADPLMEMCQRMIEMKKGSGEWERNIFLINCSMYLQHVLEAYAFTAARRSELQEQTDEWEASLLEQHYENLVKQAGLTNLRDALAKQSQSTDEPEPLSRISGADSRAVTSAVKTLEAFMTSVDVLTSARLALLTSPRVATGIHRGALERLAHDYDRIYVAVMDKANKYEFSSTLMNRTPEEVYVLLGIEAPETVV